MREILEEIDKLSHEVARLDQQQEVKNGEMMHGSRVGGGGAYECARFRSLRV
jgi:hypothetical protein